MSNNMQQARISIANTKFQEQASEGSLQLKRSVHVASPSFSQSSAIFPHRSFGDQTQHDSTQQPNDLKNDSINIQSYLV